MANGTFGIKHYITQSGVIAPNVDIIDDTVIKFIVTNAQVSNEIVFYGRLGDQSNWNVIGTMTGSGTFTFNVSTFDYVRIECLTFASIGSRIDLTGSGFVVNGFNSIITPDGEFVASGALEFISSDNSVTFDNIAPNKIDIKSINVSGGIYTKYTKTLIIADWVGPSAGEYHVTIPFSFHAKANPIVTCLISNGLDFDLINVPVTIDSSNNVIITVPENPDSRFEGKIILE